MPALAINVPIEERTIYDILFKLEAEGIIRSSLLMSLPLSKKEIRRLINEAKQSVEKSSDYTKSLIEKLERGVGLEEGVKYIKPIAKPYIEYNYTDSENDYLNYNRDGYTLEKNSNIRIGFSSVAELGKLSFSLIPEIRITENDTDFTLFKGYVKLNLIGLDFEFGRESQWWGPGYHGSILLSNNAEPFTMFKITNPEPLQLPWIFKYLGPFRFTYFVTRLEAERTVSRPYLWGLRLDFKPIPYFEIGLQRTALLGGEGRSESLSTWIKSFTGKGENEAGVEAGDQRAGIDIKITIPMKIQPIQLYLDAAGEDEAGGLPSRWAYVGGVYLPRVLNFENISLRVEFADTTVKAFNSSRSSWYKHHIYKSGYTYKGRIIGHHMGTDSKDLFVKVDYYLPEAKGKIYVSFDKEKHKYSEPQKSSSSEVSFGIEYNINESLKVVGEFKTAKLDNFNGVEDNRINQFAVQITYVF